MRDSKTNRLIVAATLLCSIACAPSVMADMTTTFEESSGVPTEIGPGVVEYRTIRRQTTTITEPEQIIIEKPVVVEKRVVRARPATVKRRVARRAAVRVAPKPAALVTTVERTIEKPIIVERPVLIDRPVEVEKQVFIDRPVDRIIEKPVIIEHQVPVASPPVIIDRPVIIEKKKKHLLNLGVL